MKRRNLILLLGGASSGAMSVGTGAFSSVEAERGVEVNVVDDDEAYLGIEQKRSVVPIDTDTVTGVDDEGSATGAVRVRNQFGDHLALNVSVKNAPDAVEAEDPITKAEGFPGDDRGDGEKLAPGEQAYIRIEQATTGTIAPEITFYAEAGGATVEKSKTFVFTLIDVDFTGGNGQGSNESNGGGAVRIDGEFKDLVVQVNHKKETRSSGESGMTVITPSDGRVNSVTIDGVTYKPDNSNSSGNSSKPNDNSNS